MPIVDIDVDPEVCRMEGLLSWAREELAALQALLPAAMDAQWSPSRVPSPRDDTEERSKGLASDPTAEIALDGRRLAVRDTVIRSQNAIRKTIVVLRGVRLAMEKALDEWEGESAT